MGAALWCGGGRSKHLRALLVQPVKLYEPHRKGILRIFTKFNKAVVF